MLASANWRVVAVALFALVSLAHPVAAQARPANAAASRVPETAAARRALLLAPTRAFWSTRAPDTVTADLETSRGTISIELVRAWAPNGVDRFYNMARAGYFDDSRFFRVVYGFVAQFGIAGDPAIARLWNQRVIKPDSVRASNVRGAFTFAQNNPKDRATNVFINLRDNVKLDTLGFAPIGRVVQGIEVADSLYAKYGEMPMAEPPLGDWRRLFRESNRYMDKEYPLMDKILKITIRPPAQP